MNLQIYEEATEWVVKHRNGGLDGGEKKSFDAWLREAPHHVRAYLEMSSVWEDLPSLESGWNPSTDELIARARADDNVVPLAALFLSAAEMPDDRPPISERPGTEIGSYVREASTETPARLIGARVARPKWKMRAFYSLAASVLVAFAGSWFYLQRGVYATGTGEQRSLALADGSTVELNSRSRITVQYSDAERRIDLLEGQALFHVAKNKLRPFLVQTGNTRVRAVGTAFDVYKTNSGAVVTVLEGRVAVRSEQQWDGANTSDTSDTPEVGTTKINVVEVSASKGAPADSQGARQYGSANPGAATIHASSGEILLDAGEQLVVTPTAVASPRRANVTSATAWTRRSLVFDSSPLTEVAQEFNRYNSRQLVIEDPTLADFHVSGVFSSVEPSLFIRFLHAQPELFVHETDREIRISKK